MRSIWGNKNELGGNIRYLSLLAILATGLIVFQNCGESTTFLDTDSSSFQGDDATLQQYRSLTVNLAEFKQDFGTSGKFFQEVRVTFSDESAFMAINQSDICRFSMSLNLQNSLQLREFFENATSRPKALSVGQSDFLHPMLSISKSTGQPVNMAVASPSEEAGLPPGSNILNEQAEFWGLIQPYLDEEYDPNLISCDFAGTTPEFLEYIQTNIVGGQNALVDAFLLENQQKVGYASLPDDQTCFQAYRLNFAERAMAIKATSIIQSTTKSGAIDTTLEGQNYMDFWEPGATSGTTYFPVAGYADDGERVILNSQPIIEDVKFIANLAKERAERDPSNWATTPIMEADPQVPGQTRQRCVVR